MSHSKHLISAVVVAMSLAAAAVPSNAAEKAVPPKPLEASIPLASFGGVQDWRADGTRGLFIRGIGMDQWYYATLMSPCTQLPFADAIGIARDARDVIDRYSSIIVRGQSCAFASLAMSEPPPSKTTKKK